MSDDKQHSTIITPVDLCLVAQTHTLLNFWCYVLQEVVFRVRNEGGTGQFWLSAAEQDGDSHVQVCVLPYIQKPSNDWYKIESYIAVSPILVGELLAVFFVIVISSFLVCILNSSLTLPYLQKPSDIV